MGARKRDHPLRAYVVTLRGDASTVLTSSPACVPSRRYKTRAGQRNSRNAGLRNVSSIYLDRDLARVDRQRGRNRLHGERNSGRWRRRRRRRRCPTGRRTPAASSARRNGQDNENGGNRTKPGSGPVPPMILRGHGTPSAPEESPYPADEQEQYDGPHGEISTR